MVRENDTGQYDITTRVKATDTRIGPVIDAVTERIERVDPLNLPVGDLVNFAQALQKQTMELLGNPTPTRQIDPETVYDMVLFAHFPRVIMWARHGKQQMDAATANLGSAEQKLSMMKLPHNMADPLTDDSIAEAVGTGLILKYMAEKNGKKIQVRTSENMCAAQAAVIIAGVSGATVDTDSRLTCINYPNGIPDVEILERLGAENKGALPWTKEVVDNVCGEGTYDKISRGVIDMYEAADYNSITLNITHTQQINVLDSLARRVPIRLAELGFQIDNLALTGRLSGVSSNGFYKPTS